MKVKINMEKKFIFVTKIFMIVQEVVLLLVIIFIFNTKLNAQQSININGNDVVPKISFPGITQSDFQEAFNVLNECLITNLPVHGFAYPFMSPGGGYAKDWWQLDGSLTLSGAKWSNQLFAENVLRDFISVQKPDGRIPLYGPDNISLPFKVSSLPKLFEVGYAIVRRTNDKELVRKLYNCLKKYLGWWLSYRQDRQSGLITGVFEESFPTDESQLKARAPVDLNVEVAVGCRNVARLAKYLDNIADYKKYTRLEQHLKVAINKYLWEDNTYYSYYITKRKFDDRLLCDTFDPLKDNIAQGARVTKLLQLLTDNRYFNWDENPVTSAAKTDSVYNETGGVYNGKQWMGDIWTMRNESIIQGLEDIGRYDLAADLSYKTVNLFNNNYAEFVIPSNGRGQGQLRYGWSASQYIQIIIENIFGVDYDEFKKTITIMPRLNESLTGKDITLDSLQLPNGNRLNLNISVRPGKVSIRYRITGGSNNMKIVLALPENGRLVYTASNKQNHSIKLTKVIKGAAQIFESSRGTKSDDEISFIQNQ
jgi:hypothetical protein